MQACACKAVGVQQPRPRLRKQCSSCRQPVRQILALGCLAWRSMRRNNFASNPATCRRHGKVLAVDVLGGGRPEAALGGTDAWQSGALATCAAVVLRALELTATWHSMRRSGRSMRVAWGLPTCGAPSQPSQQRPMHA